MKKKALLFALLISTLANAQTTDYRTTEDGINQLINNADFLDKMSHMSNEQIAATTLDKFFDEYVPEYRGFKADLKNLNTNNIYYTPDGEGNYSPKQLAGGIGKMLGMKEEEVNAFESIFDGNYQNVDLRTASSQLGNSLYKRGKNEGVDYMVDKTNSFLQEQFGSSEGASALINVGTGILGNIIFSLTEDNDVDAEKERKFQAALGEMDKRRNAETEAGGNAYSDGVHLQTDGLVKATQGDYIGALKDYMQALKLLNTSYMGGPKVVDTYIKLGQLKMVMNDHRGAIIDYYFAYKTAVKVYQKQWEPTPRVQDEILRKVGMETVDIFADKEMVDILIGRAYAKYQAHDFNGALVDCNEALKLYKAIDPKDADWKKHPNNFDLNDFTPQYHPLNNLIGLTGMVNMALGNNAEAMEQYKYNKSQITLANSMASLGALPVSFMRELMMAKSYAYYKQGNYDVALGLYDNIINNKTYVTMKGGNISIAYSGRGNIYLAKGEYQNALSDYNSAIELSPNDAAFYANRGNCKVLLKDTAGAKQDFALFSNPEAVKAVVKSVNYYYTENTKYAGKPDAENGKKGLAVMEEGMKAYPENPHIAAMCMGFIVKLKDAPKALQLSTESGAKTRNGIALKALYFYLTGDGAQGKPLLIQALDSGISLNNAATINPEIKSDPDYCMYLSKYVKNINASFTEKDLSEVRKMLADALKENNQFKQLAIVYYYEELGDFTTALQKIEAYFSANAPAVMPTTVLKKIDLLFELNRKKEAADYATTYYNSAKDGIWKDNADMKLIKNLSENHCNF